MRAVALFSGGLDSALAIKVIQEQGVEVVGVYVDIGFESNPQKVNQLQKLAEELGIELEIVDGVEEYLESILFTPKYGYGKNMNPCIDCHSFMIRKGLEVMEKVGGKFVITGEVVGQRPMSQRLPALNSVGKLVGEGRELVVRPLSAKLLPPTLPEKEGWIERAKLLDIRGRERSRQLKLAKKYKLEGFESPAGGCLLTDISFSRRLKKLGRITPAEIPILRVGRHFEIDGCRFIISRKEEENRILKKYQGDRFIPLLPQFPGPVGLMEIKGKGELEQMGADLVTSYSRFPTGKVNIGGKIWEGTSHPKSHWQKFLI
ncbi:MAG: ATP-binding protein [Epsilonproteobacteria bacterium]|jgi:tRNA-specific 2-thiouridylase|nr:ATP-binding protein [Campylobacterota bacterium]NPA89248.1 ATP-binding protein [Campylobacterota bacterium]